MITNDNISAFGHFLQGRGAIAVIRISGKEVHCLDQSFSSNRFRGKDLKKQKSHLPSLGHITEERKGG